MNYYVSVNITQGNDGDAEMVKMPLAQALRESMMKAPEDKHDCWLMSHGYSSFSNEYHRCEDNFNRIDTILLDFDNEQEITRDDGTTEKVVFDKDLMRKFEEEYKQYDFIIWESASSTKEWPKFRVIFLLDKPIEFVIEDGVKYTKKAILSIFAKFKPDKSASWYFTPTKSKVNTVRRNRGIPFQSSKVEWNVSSIRKMDAERNRQQSLKEGLKQLWLLSHPEYQEKQADVSNNDKVRHYLDTPYSKITGNGDSDNSLYRAICVCLSANDENTLEEVLNKARLERWSNNELNRKIEQARRFIRK